MPSEFAFLSYSREDSEFALRLARELKTAGARVWIDQLDIEPGARWVQAVEEAMSGAARMLVVLSPASVASANVANEFLFALEESKRVIPVLYQDCKIPFQLRPFHYADFRTDFAGGLASLLRVMQGSGIEAAASAASAPMADPIPDVVPQTPRRQNVQGGGDTSAATGLPPVERPRPLSAQTEPPPGTFEPEADLKKPKVRRALLMACAGVLLVAAIAIWSQVHKGSSHGNETSVMYVPSSAFRALKSDICQFDGTAYRGTVVTADDFLVVTSPDAYPRKSPAIQRGRPIGLSDVSDSTASPVAVVSDRLLWQSCGSDGRILGTSLLIDGRPHTVVGVFARGVVKDLQRNEVDLWFTEPTR
ncbi:MAG TPA: TIR domain-containing protein [Terracidiphilus sp.]|jgi:hypothetical protein